MRAHSDHLQHRKADRWPQSSSQPLRPSSRHIAGASRYSPAASRYSPAACRYTPATCRLASLALVALAFATTAGCGPVTTASVISDAEHDLSEVKSLEGQKNAPYEYTKAASYLHKAKELQGHGLYEQASTYARRSRVMSEKAVEVARLAQERSQRKTKFGDQPGKKAPPSFTPSGGGGR